MPSCLTLLLLMLLAPPHGVDRTDEAIQGLNQIGASGFIYMEDLRSGEVVAHAEATAAGAAHRGDGDGTLVAPLSVIKVFVAAVWLEHGFGDVVVVCDPSAGHPVRHMKVEDVLATSCDTAGERMAILLRQRLGGALVLRELRMLGLHHLRLPADASDETWGRVLSLGETDVTVTPREVASFYRRMASLKPQSRERLQAGLEATVARGTATGVRTAIVGRGVRLGGKTGTGPGHCGATCDGWFAGIVSGTQGPRYAILVYLRGKGPADNSRRLRPRNSLQDTLTHRESVDSCHRLELSVAKNPVLRPLPAASNRDT